MGDTYEGGVKTCERGRYIQEKCIEEEEGHT